MKILPAIDIKDKKCVRLVRGDFDNKTEYKMSPVEQAREYKDHGFKNLHVVDLDGALIGETVNLDIIHDIISKFDLKNVLPNSAIFDEKKLLWLNGLYIRTTDIKDFQSTALSQIENDIQRTLYDEEKSRLLKIFPSVQERIETLADLTQQVMFLIDEPFVVNELDWQDVNNEEAQKYLFLLREEFINLDNFSLDSIEIVMRKTLEEINVKTKIGFQAARVSITGTKISPPLFESVFALGREAVIARLAESIEKL